MPKYAFFKGSIVPIEDARVSIRTHALHYGTGCFEGIRGYWNEDDKQIYVFQMALHYERLHRSCKVLRIDLPYKVGELCETTLELVRREGYQQDVYIRPIAFKDAEEIGPRLHNVSDAFAIFVIPLGKYLETEKGIRCCVSTWRRVDDTSIPARAKVTGLYVNSALAKTEAADRGYDEAIMLNQDGTVSEGTGENLFLISQGTLITPPQSANILVGITRGVIARLASQELGIPTAERPVARSELYTADEVFLCGTGAEVAPVLEIDNRKVGDGNIGPITQDLQRLYFPIVRGKNAKYRDWCTPVYRVGVVP